MQREDSPFVQAVDFNRDMLKALGLGHLRGVIGLSITSGTAKFLPVVHVDMLVTKRGLEAVEALVRRQRFEMVPVDPPKEAAIDAEAVLAGGSSAADTCRLAPE